MNDTSEMPSAKCRAAAIAIAFASTPGLAEAAPMRVSVVSDSACPEATAVSQHLRRLLPPTAVVVHPAPETDVVNITDAGDHYAITARDEERSVEDLERNCEERARVAAVFAAMILDPPVIERPQAQPAPPPQTPPVLSTRSLEGATPERPTPKRELSASDVSAWLSVGILTTWAGSSEQPLALGPEVAVRIGRGMFQLQSSIAITTPIALRFGDARTEVVRLPANVSAYVTTQGSDADVAVGLGLAVEGLHVAGRGDFTPHTQSVLQMGVRAAARGRLLFDEGKSVFCEVNGTFVPSTHDLAIEPDGIIGSTPAVWLGLTLGGSMGLL